MYFNADNREETIVKAVFSVDYINNEPINLDIENFLSEFRQKYQDDVTILENQFVKINYSAYILLVKLYQVSVHVTLGADHKIQLLENREFENISEEIDLNFEQRFMMKALTEELFDYEDEKYNSILKINNKLNAWLSFKLSSKYRILKLDENLSQNPMLQLKKKMVLLQKYFRTKQIQSIKFKPCKEIFKILSQRNKILIQRRQTFIYDKQNDLKDINKYGYRKTVNFISSIKDLESLKQLQTYCNVSIHKKQKVKLISSIDQNAKKQQRNFNQVITDLDKMRARSINAQIQNIELTKKKINNSENDDEQLFPEEDLITNKKNQSNKVIFKLKNQVIKIKKMSKVINSIKTPLPNNQVIIKGNQIKSFFKKQTKEKKSCIWDKKVHSNEKNVLNIDSSILISKRNSDEKKISLVNNLKDTIKMFKKQNTEFSHFSKQNQIYQKKEKKNSLQPSSDFTLSFKESLQAVEEFKKQRKTVQNNQSKLNKKSLNQDLEQERCKMQYTLHSVSSNSEKEEQDINYQIKNDSLFDQIEKGNNEILQKQENEQQLLVMDSNLKSLDSHSQNEDDTLLNSNFNLMNEVSNIDFGNSDKNLSMKFSIHQKAKQSFYQSDVNMEKKYSILNQRNHELDTSSEIENNVNDEDCKSDSEPEFILHEHRQTIENQSGFIKNVTETIEENSKSGRKIQKKVNKVRELSDLFDWIDEDIKKSTITQTSDQIQTSIKLPKYTNEFGVDQNQDLSMKRSNFSKYEFQLMKKDIDINNSQDSNKINIYSKEQRIKIRQEASQNTIYLFKKSHLVLKHLLSFIRNKNKMKKKAQFVLKIKKKKERIKSQITSFSRDSMLPTITEESFKPKLKKNQRNSDNVYIQNHKDPFKLVNKSQICKSMVNNIKKNSNLPDVLQKIQTDMSKAESKSLIGTFSLSFADKVQIKILIKKNLDLLMLKLVEEKLFRFEQQNLEEFKNSKEIQYSPQSKDQTRFNQKYSSSKMEEYLVKEKENGKPIFKKIVKQTSNQIPFQRRSNLAVKK